MSSNPPSFNPAHEPRIDSDTRGVFGPFQSRPGPPAGGGALRFAQGYAAVFGHEHQPGPTAKQEAADLLAGQPSIPPPARGGMQGVATMMRSFLGDSGARAAARIPVRAAPDTAGCRGAAGHERRDPLPRLPGGLRPSLGRSWTAGLVMAFSGLAQAGENLCSGGQCGATGVSPALLRKAVRGAVLDAPLTPQPARPSPPAAAASDASATWERRLAAADGREGYDCALSFGVGASLGGERFLATRLLGRTRVWRDDAAR